MTEYPVVKSKEEEFGVLVVGRRNGEDGVKRCSINVGILSDNGDQWRRRYPEMWCVWPCISTGRRREEREGRGSSKCRYRSSPVSDSLCRCG